LFFKKLFIGQTWLVDQLSRCIDNKLDFIKKKKQPSIFGGGLSSRHAEDAIMPSNDVHERDEGNHGEASNSTFLSSEFHGSPRHLKQLAQESLCVVAEKGKPSLFITFTANAKWSEITDRLLPGQTAFDRPEVVNQVFHAKLQAAVANLKKGHYFGHGIDVNGKHVHKVHKVTYLMYVIEYQHRGLPHAHLVLQFDNMPGSLKIIHIMFLRSYVPHTLPSIPNRRRGRDPSLDRRVHY
jgi:hypothetical protein